MLNHRGNIPCLAERSYVWGCRCVGRLFTLGWDPCSWVTQGMSHLHGCCHTTKAHSFIFSSPPLPSLLVSALQCSSLAAVLNLSDNSITPWVLLECLPTPICLPNFLLPLHICPSYALNSLIPNLVFCCGLHLESQWCIQQSRKLFSNPVLS